MTTAESGLTGNEFLDKLLERTPPAASQPRHGQNYNYPQRRYLKPDGSVVLLQGDPVNRAYYQDKGYQLLSQTPGRDGGLSEEQQYVQLEYPKILKEQREKAAIINAIRRAGERYRDLNLEDTFDEYTVDELREYLADIKRETGKDIRVILPKRAQAREDARDAALLNGVETQRESLESLQAKLGSGQPFQGTGYDPIDQARRRAPRPSGSGNPTGGAA
jgi:hypothetical protein